MSDPIEGELTVEASAVPIQSIDMHLLRVESILVGEKIATESSLIQTTQVWTAPVFPRNSLYHVIFTDIVQETCLVY